MQSLWLIIVVFFLVLLILPIFAKLHLSYDFINNMGAISLYIFFVKIFAYRFKIKNKNIVLITKKGKKEIETAVSKSQMRFLEQINAQFRQKVVVRKIYAYARIGTGDAYSSAMLGGLFTSAVSSVLGFIKNIKKSAKIGVFNEPDYNGHSLTFSIYGSFSLTIVDILYSLIMAVVIIKRSEKYERV